MHGSVSDDGVGAEAVVKLGCGARQCFRYWFIDRRTSGLSLSVKHEHSTTERDIDEHKVCRSRWEVGKSGWGEDQCCIIAAGASAGELEGPRATEPQTKQNCRTT